MSLPESVEPVRHGALELLASGNSVESVAHVFGVSVDVVTAWQAGSAEVPPVAPVPEPTLPSADSGYARNTSSARFDSTLDYSASTAYRRMMFCGGIVILGVTLWLLLKMIHDGVANSADIGLMLLMSLGMGSVAATFLRLSRISLVLDEDDIVVPGLFRDARMPYSELAGYSIEPAVILAMRGGGLEGEMLRIRSLRPGVEPLEVFIVRDYPLDGDVRRRLDDVSQANRARHALPAGAATVLKPNLGGWLFLVASIAVGMMLFAPMLRDGLRVWRHDIPTPAQLQHREGRFTAASTCYRPSGRDSSLSMKVRIEDAASAPLLLLPCVLDYSVLMNREPHRVAVDFDATELPPDNVYQVALDGHTVLDYDTSRAHQQHDIRAAAKFEVVMSLVAMGMSLLFPVLVLRRRSRVDEQQPRPANPPR